MKKSYTKRLDTFINPLVHTSTFIALAATLSAYSSTIVLGYNLNFTYYFTIFLLYLSIYNILKKTFYSPIGYEFKGKQYISVIAFIFGNSIMVTPKMRGDKAYIMTTSGKDLINAVDENLSKTKGKNICFGLISSCLVRLETLGSQVYEVHKKLKEHFGEKPFIQVYLVGEDIYSKELGARRIAESYNSAIFYQK